jgi:glycine/D-amino acid oxidase-like deaminating enzyme
MPSASAPEPTVAVVGAGIFGVATALALRRRGYAVTLLDPGPLPHPLVASTDISKIVRLDYGPDADYTALRG